jgi:hypothetical protein
MAGGQLPHIVTEPDVSLPCSQQPVARPYSDPSKPSPHPPTPFFRLVSSLWLSPTHGLIPSYFSTIMLYEIPLSTTSDTSPANNIIFHNTYTNNEPLFLRRNSPKPSAASLLGRLHTHRLFAGIGSGSGRGVFHTYRLTAAGGQHRSCIRGQSDIERRTGQTCQTSKFQCSYIDTD